MCDLLRRRAVLIEPELDPLVDKFLREFETDDALAETEDLGVVREHAALDAVWIVGGDSADAFDFVRGDGDA